LKGLQRFARPIVGNNRGEEVGEIRPAFRFMAD